MSANCSSNPFRKKSLSMKPFFIPADNVSCDDVPRQLADVEPEAPHVIRGLINDPKKTDNQSFPLSPESASYKINNFERAQTIDPSLNSVGDRRQEDSKGDGFVDPLIAPVNPFESTIKTIKQYSKGEGLSLPKQNRFSPGRQSLNFHTPEHLLPAGSISSSTEHKIQDVALTSEENGGFRAERILSGHQFLRDSTPEPYNESSQIPNDESWPEENQRNSNKSISSLQHRPPPPSSRHGKLIKVQVNDFSLGSMNVSQISAFDNMIHSSNPNSSSKLNYTQNNLNKPLPPAPLIKFKHLKHHSLICQTIQNELSPKSSPDYRKRPPTPPLARRHSQSITKIGDHHIEFPLNSKNDTGPHSISFTDQNSTLFRSQSGKAPLPPPSRRSGTSQSFLENKSPPKPPLTPTRKNSRSGGGTSTWNSPLPTILSANVNTSKRLPPPPPQRGTIINAALRRGSVESISTSDIGYPQTFKDGLDGGEKVVKSKIDILADLSQLQKEIDELRAKKEEKAVV